MKKGLEILLIIISILAVSFVSAIAVEDSLHLNIQVTNSSNNNSILTGTFNFVFNISTSADCSNILYTNSTTLTTDSRGVISYYLGNVNLDYSEQYWLCYYRNNVLINASKIARVPYAFRAKNVTLSGVEIDSSLNLGNFNLTASIGNFGVQVTNYALNVRGNVNVTGNITLGEKINGVTLPPPTCSGTEKLTFNGVSFSCSVDILGSGGSGIIASASNASRSYIQFADGTMIETINYNGVISSTVQTAIAIPQPFIDGNYTVQAIGDYQTWATADNAFTNGGQNNGSYVHLRSFTANSANAHYRITIIGRWTTLTNITQNTTSWAVNGNGDTVLFDTTKKVGIGTTSPNQKLSLMTTTADAIERIGYSDIYYWDIGRNITDARLMFINTHDSAIGERMTILSSGNVGIGTTTPERALNVRGSGNFSGTIFINNATDISTFTLRNYFNQQLNTTSSPIFANLTLADIYAAGGRNLMIGDDTYLTDIDVASTLGIYSTSDSTVGSIKLGSGGGIISGYNSNVGIGTTTPSQKLEVAGNVNATGNITSSGGRVYDKTGYAGIPGEIRMYGGSTAPIGWLLCDNSAVSRTTYADLFAAIGTTFGTGDGSTTFNVPDMRGIFPRGAGTSGKLSMANGTAFAGTLGTYQNDKFQGHYHTFLHGLSGGGSNPAIAYANVASVPSMPYTGLNFVIREAITDGTNGVPRTGAETNPANLGLTFIIKY